MRQFAPLFAAFSLLLTGCVATHTPLATAERTTTAERPLMIIVSIDGFRPDYLERGLTPHMNALRQGGAYGEMIPAFPSLTFPNHYTLVTGLRPDHHGVVGNTMNDARRPDQRFTLSNAAAVTDAFWWDGGTPFWVSAEQAGVRTGTYFWPGSEAPIHGVRPSKYTAYNKDILAPQRVGNLLGWMDLPAQERPQAYTLYFDTVDTLGHQYGPDSAEVNAAIAETDAVIGQLVAGLEARGLKGKVNILIVSDHGMAAHDPAKFTSLKDLLPEGSYEVVGGAVAGITPKPGHEAEVEAALLKPHPHMDCWKKSELPARFQYGTHPRIAPIVCLAAMGGYIYAPGRNNWSPRPAGGSHGYDPAAPEMRAVFMAAGPDFKPGVRLSPFANVDVYSLIMHLIGVDPVETDGSLEALRPALKP